MKRLALKNTGETVSVRGVGASGKTSNHPTSQVTLTSRFQKDWVRDIRVIGMEQMTEAIPTQQISYVRKLPYLKGLELADDQFDVPGKIDLLLGQNVYKHLLLPQCVTGPKDQPDARLTVFGWALMGPYTHNFQQNSKTAITCVAAAEAEDSMPLDQLLRKFWEVEETTVFKTELTPTEKKVEEHYSQTHQYLPEEKRYLPKIEKEVALGESQTQALNRAKANERSLLRRNVWPQFQEVMQEYVDLGHAKPVLLSDSQPTTAVYFMPVHAVFKSSSTSTKIRAVFDASASTTNKLSLNDLRPTLHPTLDQILMKFRTYAIAVTGDIQKMYREVMLHPEDQPLHRFMWRQKTNENWQSYQMTRVTFGVTSSPYLAVKTLQTTGQDFGKEDPVAQWHILKSFYVDDLMAGADTIKEAIALYQRLKTILSHANFNLKKWRSSSKEVLESIPADLQERLPTQELVDLHSASYPKALGVTWDLRNDTMSTHVNMSSDFQSTKRGVIRDIAKLFDVLGWLSPAILPMKELYRKFWTLKLDWDEEIPKDMKDQHLKWRTEFKLLASVKLPRHYFQGKIPLSVELHGFSDASTVAYAAVIYARATYASGPPSSSLIVAKTKVAPLKSRTIPELELCGATLLAKLMTTTRQMLDVPMDRIFAYSDSTTVIAWLDGTPKRYTIYKANRIATTVELIPTRSWRYVPTKENPADPASRGTTAAELKCNNLWWHGPDWLVSQPIRFPKQPSETEIKRLKEEGLRPLTCNVKTVIDEDFMESKFNSFNKMLRVMCRIRRLAEFIRTKEKLTGVFLTTQESREATLILVLGSQRRSFSAEINSLVANPPKDISQRSSILILHPKVDDKGVLRVGGRLGRTNLPQHIKHPIILSAKDNLTRLLFKHYHLELGHCGPTALLHILATSNM